MKILQTPVRFYPAVGGVEQYALDLSRELVRRGIDATVICANEPQSKITSLDGIHIERLYSLCKIAGTNLTPTLFFKLLRSDYDIVHTYLPTPWSADWSVIIAKLKRKRVVLSYCNDIVGRGFGNIISKIYNATILKLTLKLADRIIIIGPDYIKSSKYLKNYSSKIHFIPIGVDRKRFKKMAVQKKEKTLFFLSVLNEYHKYKGLDYLLEAIQLVKEKVPEVKLIIGGSGSLLKYYKGRVTELFVKENVEFCGYIPDNKMVEYYNRAEVFILPSVDSAQEGFGIVALEALACGTPVITTGIVGIANEVLENNAGIVVPVRDARALADAIVRILTNSGLKDKFSHGAALVATKFDIINTTGEIIKQYRYLLSDNTQE